jgi:hypothetical protein
VANKAKMGVDESIVVGIGAVIFDDDLKLPTEDDFKAFTPNDYFFKDAYDEKAPIAFFYETHTLNKWAPGKNQLPKNLYTSERWSITDLDGAIYDKAAIIEKILEQIVYEDPDDAVAVDLFKAKIRHYLQNSEKVYFGRFIYWYFS